MIQLLDNLVARFCTQKGNVKEKVEDPSIVTDIMINIYDSKEEQGYKGTDWRKAINRFLDGIWIQHEDIIGGIIAFDAVSLTLDEGVYKVQRPTDLKEHYRPLVARHRILAIPCDRNNVELGFAKFVRSDEIHQLTIEFDDDRLMFWKDHIRTHLHFTVAKRKF